ncbi:MAG: nitrogen regulation protein, partial [Pseudomonadota bacterium]
MTQGKILVVDDDDAIRLVIHEALSREGHEVRTAASVAEQAKILSQFEPDV